MRSLFQPAGTSTGRSGRNPLSAPPLPNICRCRTMSPAKCLRIRRTSDGETEPFVFEPSTSKSIRYHCPYSTGIPSITLSISSAMPSSTKAFDSVAAPREKAATHTVCIGFERSIESETTGIGDHTGLKGGWCKGWRRVDLCLTGSTTCEIGVWVCGMTKPTTPAPPRPRLAPGEGLGHPSRPRWTTLQRNPTAASNTTAR